MGIKYNDTTRSIIRAVKSTPIVVSIDLETDVKRGLQAVFQYTVEIGGYDTEVTLTHEENCYPTEEYQNEPHHHVWDTPRIDFSSMDAFYGIFSPKVIGKTIQAVLELHAHINEKR